MLCQWVKARQLQQVNAGTPQQPTVALSEETVQPEQKCGMEQLAGGEQQCDLQELAALVRVCQLTPT